MRLTSRSVIENPPSIPATVRVGQSGGYCDDGRAARRRRSGAMDRSAVAQLDGAPHSCVLHGERGARHRIRKRQAQTIPVNT
ncbi:hypothetical protein,hypothetical protein [Burkholderia pseudomallei]|nr:hypothetical protein Y047_6220 [Burkholderia pseudomallei MSHR3016]VUD47533.1 hypothetical protein,hypothetical protein [Burkholderia pseudomallei]